jgi:hypothetical protein
LGTAALDMTITIDSTGNGGSRPFTTVLCPAGWCFCSSSFFSLFCKWHCHRLLLDLFISIGLGLDSFWEALRAWDRLRGRVGASGRIMLLSPAMPRLVKQDRSSMGASSLFRPGLGRTVWAVGVYCEGLGWVSGGWQGPLCKLTGFGRWRD